MPSKKKRSSKTLDFGPDPVIDPPELPRGGPLAFFKMRLLPLLSDSSSEKVFAEKGVSLLRELWRMTHSLRPPEDREKRGRPSVKLPAMQAICRGLENKEIGRSGRPTQGDLERILERWISGLDKETRERILGRGMSTVDADTRRKYARLYRLTHLELPEAHSVTQWARLAREDPDYVHRAFFTFGMVRYSAKERAGSGIRPTTKEEDAIRCYVRICEALITLGKPFSAPGYIETIAFPSSYKDK